MRSFGLTPVDVHTPLCLSRAGHQTRPTETRGEASLYVVGVVLTLCPNRISVGRFSLPGYTNPHPFPKTDEFSRTFANPTLSKGDVYRDSASRRVRPHCASGPAVVFASPLPTQFQRFVLENSVRLRRPRPKAGQHPIAHMRRITYKQNFLKK